VREATYYGNLFQKEQPRYACLPPSATQITRVCGDSLVGCAVAIAGACEKVCESPGRNGTYRDCAAQELNTRDGNSGKSNDETYAETVTVFLAP